MLYIHQYSCISPQETFGQPNLSELRDYIGTQLTAIEPSYQGIPPGILRRMGKAVRMGVGAALPIVGSDNAIDGIIIGTANGGMEDCIKFLNQIIDYEEGMLTPGNFVQSTPNAIAGQLGLMTKNHGYNITHVHRGLAFENSLCDVLSLLEEQPGNQYLLGAVDEISAYNYNIDLLGGWYRRETGSSLALTKEPAEATMAGEGSAFFLLNDRSAAAVARIEVVHTIHTEDLSTVLAELDRHPVLSAPADVFMSGFNGDIRFKEFYDKVGERFPKSPVACFKSLCGEYPTATGFAVWLSAWLLDGNSLPAMPGLLPEELIMPESILIYNHYKGSQHSFIRISKK